jgi:hypothetical protein
MGFSEFVKAYGKGATLLFASAAVSYFLTFYSTLSPPIKPRQAIYGMSVLVEAYGILIGLNSNPSRKPPLPFMISSIVFYLTALFSLTFLVPTSESSYREAIGFVCKAKFLELYGPNCFWIDPEILAKASHEPGRIWELWSIDVVRAFLGAAWLLLVWSVVTSIAISIRHTNKVRRKAVTKI